MIAAFHGNNIRISRLREFAGTDRTGTTIAGLIGAAERIGFSAKAVRAVPDAIRSCALPMIAHWKEGGRNHFIVVYQFQGNFVRIADPACGKRKLTLKQFEENWTGILLLFNKTDRLAGTPDSPSASGRLHSILRRHFHLFLDVLIAAALITILGLASSFFIQAFIDFVFVTRRKPALNWLGLGMLVVLLARSAFQALRTYLLAHLSQRIGADTGMHYYRHLLGLPLTFFASRETGEILSRLKDALKIPLASLTIVSIANDLLMLGATTLAMLVLNWRATAPSLLIAFTAFLILWQINQPMKEHRRNALNKAAEVEGLLIETVHGIRTIKALRAENNFQLRMEARFAGMLDSAFRSQMLVTRSVFVTSAGSGLCTLTLLWFGGLQVLDGNMTVGQLMGLHAMLGIFLVPLERLAVANWQFQDRVHAIDRWSEIADANEEQPTQINGFLDRSINGNIEFDRICFGYRPDFAVLCNVSFRVEAGQSVGIRGDTGSGKTTLIHLLTRFVEPSQGTIYIDATDSRNYTIECLRREIALVPTDTVLFDGSLADNIRLGNPAASAEEMRAAVQATRLEETANRLQHGFETNLAGASLSRCERQRIGLARALLQNPAVLIVDEFSGPPEPLWQDLLTELLNERRGKRTTIVISRDQLNFDKVVCLSRESQ